MTDVAAAAGPRRVLIVWILGLVRYAVAWAVACVVAVLALYGIATLLDILTGAERAGADASIGAIARSLLPVLMAVGATSGPAWPVVVLVMRVIRAPRGWGDFAFAALAADVVRVLVFDPSSTPTLLAIFGAAGGIGGLAFWLVAGLPRRPYRHLLLPGRRARAQPL